MPTTHAWDRPRNPADPLNRLGAHGIRTGRRDSTAQSRKSVRIDSCNRRQRGRRRTDWYARVPGRGSAHVSTGSARRRPLLILGGIRVSNLRDASQLFGVRVGATIGDLHILGDQPWFSASARPGVSDTVCVERPDRHGFGSWLEKTRRTEMRASRRQSIADGRAGWHRHLRATAAAAWPRIATGVRCPVARPRAPIAPTDRPRAGNDPRRRRDDDRRATPKRLQPTTQCLTAHILVLITS